MEEQFKVYDAGAQQLVKVLKLFKSPTDRIEEVQVQDKEGNIYKQFPYMLYDAQTGKAFN